VPAAKFPFINETTSEFIVEGFKQIARSFGGNNAKRKVMFDTGCEGAP
jgi:hypothetical protein